MKTKMERFKTSKEFGKSLGLSDIEMDIIIQKKKLAKKLREKRIEEEMSQEELAEMAGTKQPSIARMESGQVSEVSMDFLIKVAMILELSVTIRPLKMAA